VAISTAFHHPNSDAAVPRLVKGLTVEAKWLTVRRRNSMEPPILKLANTRLLERDRP
jgi:hypothetical protein